MEIDRLYLAPSVERIDGSEVNLRFFPPGQFGRIGSTRVRIILKANQITHVEQASPALINVHYQVLQPDSAEVQDEVTGVMIYRRLQPQQATGWNQYYWDDIDGAANITSYFREEEGRKELVIKPTGTGPVEGWFPENYQYNIGYGGSGSLSRLGRFSTVDPGNTDQEIQCRADINRDEIVDLTDYSMFISKYALSSSCGYR